MEASGLEALTPREREILIKIAEGMTLMDIAHDLHRSLKTIESHRLAIGRKLQARNRVELVRIAIEHGLVTLRTSARTATNELSAERQRPIQNDPIAQQFQRRIADRLYDKAAAGYVNELSCSLCDVLDVAYAGVCVQEQDTDGKSHIRSLAHSTHGSIADQFFYLLEGTSCASVLEHGSLQIQRGAREAYVNDHMLSELDADAYYGIALRDPAGRSIGALWLIDTKPSVYHDTIPKLLEYYAVRVNPVVIDIEKTRQALILCETRGDRLSLLNEQLKKKNEQLDELAEYYIEIAERMSDGLVVLSTTWHIDYANERFADIVKADRSKLLGTSILDLMTPQGREKFKSMQEVRQADQMSHYKVDALLTDGSVKEVLVAPRTRYDSQGQFNGSFAIVSDQADI